MCAQDPAHPPQFICLQCVRVCAKLFTRVISFTLHKNTMKCIFSEFTCDFMILPSHKPLQVPKSSKAKDQDDSMLLFGWSYFITKNQAQGIVRNRRGQGKKYDFSSHRSPEDSRDCFLKTWKKTLFKFMFLFTSWINLSSISCVPECYLGPVRSRHQASMKHTRNVYGGTFMRENPEGFRKGWASPQTMVQVWLWVKERRKEGSRCG